MFKVKVNYNGTKVKITNNHKFDEFKKSVEQKLNVSLDNHQLQYEDGEDWVEIIDDDDLEDVKEETSVRIIPTSGGKLISDKNHDSNFK